MNKKDQQLLEKAYNQVGLGTQHNESITPSNNTTNSEEGNQSALELKLKQNARDIWEAVPYQQFINEAIKQVSYKGYNPTDSEEKLKSFMSEVRTYGKTTTAAPRDLAAQLFNIEHDRITTARTDSPLAKALVAKFKENTPSKE